MGLVLQTLGVAAGMRKGSRERRVGSWGNLEAFLPLGKSSLLPSGRPESAGREGAEGWGGEGKGRLAEHPDLAHLKSPEQIPAPPPLTCPPGSWG